MDNNKMNEAFSHSQPTNHKSTGDHAHVLVKNPKCYTRAKRLRMGRSNSEFRFFEHNPDIVLAILASKLHPRDLASLELTCKYFRKPAGLFPDYRLSITEVVALDMCEKRTMFKLMKNEERDALKKRCGGSWKLVLGYLMAGEDCSRRGKCHAIAGPGHSIVVTDSGHVYSFGCNKYGQLGHGTTQDELKPRLIKSLQGIRIIHAAVGVYRTIVVSDVGNVFVFGRDTFDDSKDDIHGSRCITFPKLVESLESIFVVQVTIGYHFTAVLSREGRVYMLCWGAEAEPCHGSDPNDRTPRLLNGALGNIPVVQIAAGNCYLLALAWQANSMLVYSLGCGLGGKLGHGGSRGEKYPRLIRKFITLNLRPISISAGLWHAAVVGSDGRICTWGYGEYGCLGHGNRMSLNAPEVIKSLEGIKIVQVVAGDHSTFVVAENGDVYSFGNPNSSLGHPNAAENLSDEQVVISQPRLVSSLRQRKERVVYITCTNSDQWAHHTLALTRSGKLYGFGAGDKGQLGLNLAPQILDGDMCLEYPQRLDIDLS